MKTIKLQEHEYVTLATGTVLQEVPEHVTIDQLRQRKGRSSWDWRKRINKHPKRFCGTEDKAESHRLINRDYHLLTGGEAVESRRNESPSLTDVANAMLAASEIRAKNAVSTRRGYLTGMKAVVSHLATGTDPVIEKNEDGIPQILPGSKWDKIKISQLDEEVVIAFQERWTKGYKGIDYHKRGRGANSYLTQAKAIFKETLIDKVYAKQFKMPKLDSFLKAEELDVPENEYEAPEAEQINAIFSKLDELKEWCVDAYAVFLLAYGAGLRWGEIKQARWDWLKVKTLTTVTGEAYDQWMITIKATDTWTPKHNSIGTVKLGDHTGEIAQALIDTRYAERKGPKPSPDWKPGQTDFIIQKYRANSQSGANRRLADWFRMHGWDRLMVTHEMRKYHGAVRTTQTGDLYDTQKQMRHKSVRTTATSYADQINQPKSNFPLPKG
tara:strand:- start:348 stop:1667 length:1320 start_codon:yes stop_codon:yes gene_type:complete